RSRRHLHAHPFPTRRSSDLDTRKLLASLDETLKGVDVLLKSVDAGLVPDLRRTLDTAGQTLKSAEVTLKSAEGTLSNVSPLQAEDRKSTRLNSSHEWISYAV